jgi:ribonuclease-3
MTINNTQIKFDWDEFMAKTIKNVGEKNLINYILNEKNRVITREYIKNTMNNYGIDYQVNDIKLFQIAMTHTSYIKKDLTNSKNFKSIFMGINLIGGDMLVPIAKEQIEFAVPLGAVSYERLEYLGDSILRQVISDYLFVRYKEMQEGNLTKLRSQIENGSSLAEMTRRIGLQKYVLLSRNQEVIKARDKNDKIQCDIFEAFVAALYLDTMKISYSDIGKSLDLIQKDRSCAYQVCYDFVISLIEDEIDLTELLETDTNYKDKLLQYYHECNWGDPKYNTMDVLYDNSKLGKKYFKMYVRDLDGNIIGTGMGSSKQKGEKMAAKKALQFLKVIPNDNEDEVLDPESDLIYHRKIKKSDKSDKTDKKEEKTKKSDKSDKSEKTDKTEKSEKSKKSKSDIDESDIKEKKSKIKKIDEETYMMGTSSKKSILLN